MGDGGSGDGIESLIELPNGFVFLKVEDEVYKLALHRKS